MTAVRDFLNLTPLASLALFILHDSGFGILLSTRNLSIN